MKRNADKILFISYYFPPAGGSGVLRIIRFVKNMQYFNKVPYVLTVDKRDVWKLGYGTTRTDSSYMEVESFANVKRVRLQRPSLLIISIIKYTIKHIKILLSSIINRLRFKDRKQILRKDNSEYIDVKDIKSNYLTDINPVLKFVFDLVFIIDQTFEWAPRAVWRGMRFVRRNDIGIVCSSSPPWSVHIVGCVLKLFCHVRWIVDLRDPIFGIETEEFRTKTAPWLIRMFYGAIESIIMRAADVIICNCEEIQAYYEKKYPGARFVVIRNSFDPDDYEGIVSEPDSHEIFRIGHFGALYPTIRTPHAFLEAFSEAVEENPAFHDSVTVYFYGADDYTGSKSFQDLIKRLGITSMVEYHHYIDHNIVLQKMASADLLLLLQPHYSTNFQIPAKLYEYIAVRRPLLAVAPDGSATSRLINEYELGVVCDPNDRAAIKTAIAQALKGEIRLPDEDVVDQFSARHMAGKMVEVMNSL